MQGTTMTWLVILGIKKGCHAHQVSTFVAVRLSG
jgi:hypothetical protein